MADLHNPTKLMFFWGSNLASTSEEGQIYSQVGAQLKGGAKMIVVDPRGPSLPRGRTSGSSFVPARSRPWPWR